MVLVDLVVLDTQPRRDPGALLRTDEVFTPSEEVQLLKARVEYQYILGQLYIQGNLTSSFKCRSKRRRSSI